MVDISYLQNKLQQRQYKAGARIVPQNQNKELYIVVSGKVDVFAITKERALEKIDSMLPGQSFGQKYLFGMQSQDVFQAAVDTVVFVVTQENFERIAKNQPAILYGLLKEAYIGGKVIEQQKEPLLFTEEPTAAPGKQEPKIPSSDIFPVRHKGYPGVTHPEYKEAVIEKSYTCPNCSRNFGGAKILQSKLVPDGSMRYDLRKKYKDFDPAWYEILTCPHCYFSMFTDCFAEPKKLSKIKIQGDLARVPQKFMLDFDSERDLDFVFGAHYIALICAHGYPSEHQLAMKIWSNLSWLYEDINDKVMETHAARKSASSSEKAYMDGTNLNPIQEQLLCLSTAGMLYRAGEEKDVMKWLFNAKTNRQGKPAYADLAERLMDDIKEEKNKASQ